MATVYVGCVQFIVSVFPNEVKYSALYFTWKYAVLRKEHRIKARLCVAIFSHTLGDPLSRERTNYELCCSQNDEVQIR